MNSIDYQLGFTAGYARAKAEVKRGRWIVIAYPSDPDYEIAQCSICGYENAMVEVFDRKGYHYCPNCGAKMDEVEND